MGQGKNGRSSRGTSHRQEFTGSVEPTRVSEGRDVSPREKKGVGSGPWSLERTATGRERTTESRPCLYEVDDGPFRDRGFYKSIVGKSIHLN